MQPMIFPADPNFMQRNAPSSSPRCRSYLMHPSSRRVGPTSARNSASSKDSCPSRAFNKTMSVTASFGSLPALDEFPLREALLLTRRPLLPARRPPTDFFARFAIKPGLYRNTTETPAPNTIATRNCQNLAVFAG